MGHNPEFAHEHPAGASSWKEDSTQAVLNLPGIYNALFDQCQFGLVSPRGTLLKKKTRILCSNMPSTAAIVVLVRTRENYPLALCHALLDACCNEGTACGAMRALDLPETEAPHPGVSSGGVEVEGGLTGNGSPGGVEVEGAVFVRASLTRNRSPSSGRQLPSIVLDRPPEAARDSREEEKHIIGLPEAAQDSQKEGNQKETRRKQARTMRNNLNPPGRTMQDNLNPPGQTVRNNLNPPGQTMRNNLNPPGQNQDIALLK